MIEDTYSPKGPSQDPQDEFSFNPYKYEDGTNVLAGTEFLEETLRTADWYFPAKSKGAPKWEEKWLTLRSRFVRLVD